MAVAPIRVVSDSDRRFAHSIGALNMVNALDIAHRALRDLCGSLLPKESPQTAHGLRVQLIDA